LLTIINAPFDWLSIGITRGLLWRGLELRGPWPAALALLDAALATALIALLCASMVVAVQTFDLAALRGGGQALLPLTPLFDNLEVEPTAPQNWWLHAIWLSTLLPSALNLVVGCTSWLRAWPWLSKWLLRQMPERRDAGHRVVANRLTVASVLTLQWALGGVLGLAAMTLVVWGVLGQLMPALGWGLLDLMRALADWHLPYRLWCWLA